MKKSYGLLSVSATALVSIAYSASGWAMGPSLISEHPHTLLLGGEAGLSFWKNSRIDRSGDGVVSPSLPSWTWNPDSKSLQVCPNWCGDIETRQSYGDFFLHVEWKTPKLYDREMYHEQQRGNSGVLLQGRYELQILDSYQHPLEDKNDAGAFYELFDADTNAARPPGEWQVYDIQFNAPKFNEAREKIANAKVSVWWNGVKIHADRELPHPTTGAIAEEAPTGPIRLQDHFDPEGRVEFRNIWIR